MMNIDPRIGSLNSGKFYAYVNGYDKPGFVGSLQEVEAKLGLRRMPSKAASAVLNSWNVKLNFQYPSWDEINGIDYLEVIAESKSKAIARVRRQASDDGHAVSGRGCYWFTATVSND